jgi:hypothetical protein
VGCKAKCGATVCDGPGTNKLKGIEDNFRLNHFLSLEVRENIKHQILVVFLIVASDVEVSVQSCCSYDVEPLAADLIVEWELDSRLLLHGNVSLNNDTSQRSVGRIGKVKFSPLPRSVVPSPWNYHLEACTGLIVCHVSKINVEKINFNKKNNINHRILEMDGSAVFSVLDIQRNSFSRSIGVYQSSVGQLWWPADSRIFGTSSLNHNNDSNKKLRESRY